ncbi:MAG: two-component system nitrogen regulation response regulator NtrX [Lysobacterales bacterium]|jgi:two-component system nitrogen regulation response regulator NtrX
MPQAKILVVDDEPDIRHLVSEILADEGYSVSSAKDGQSARLAYANEKPDLVLLDIWMPDIDGISLLKEWSSGGSLACPVVVMSGHGTLETAVEATRLGAHDFIQKPLSLAKLLATVKHALDAHQSKSSTGRRQIGGLHMDPIGNSPSMQILRQKAEQAARHSSPILIIGETGSGKETTAAYIHRSGAHAGKFKILDHFRLRGSNAKQYLFGEMVGDTINPGLIDEARNGTLFIPEIQQLSLEAQEMINLAFEAGRYHTEGSDEVREISCRVVASAPENLEILVQNGTVSEQLYYRLNVLPLHVPALRSRPEDIPELVRFYAEWFPNNEALPYRQFSISALNRLRNHSWPGNIRELRNLVQMLLILCVEGDVTVQEVEEALQHNASETSGKSTARPGSFDLPLREAREQFERDYLCYQLRKAGGSVGKLSESVGMERTHLYRKLRSLGIDPKSAMKGGEPN